MDRSTFSKKDSITHIWTDILGLPNVALAALDVFDDEGIFSSSFKVEHLAHSSIVLSALTAALFWSIRQECALPQVSVSAKHACIEFMSERLYTLNGKPPVSSWGSLGGLHKTADGHVRMHDNFPNHQQNALKVLSLPADATREDVTKKMATWPSVELETKAFSAGAVIAALRSKDEWDTLPQANAIADSPILINRFAGHNPYLPSSGAQSPNAKCLRGIRVVEMSRVIAAPVAGKTLAAHGADVIWVTSPNLPDLPNLDIDLSRGKRTVQLNIKHAEDNAKLIGLLREADVFIQSYRPGSLAAQGLSIEELTKINPNLIVASLNAYGSDGPWSQNRGFDSLVQTCSGLNVEDAKRYGQNEVARVLPCQALDHGAGYFLAAGIIAALYKRAADGGSYEVKVSLAGVMKYLRSLGQFEERSGFERKNFETSKDVEEYIGTYHTAFGELRAVRHAASIEGVEVGWDEMPKPLGSDRAEWL